MSGTPIRLFLARHAEPAWQIEGVSYSDPVLTARGRRQAELLAERLAAEPIDEILCSPTNRTVETAGFVAKALGIEPTVVPGLAEIGMPDFTGEPADKVDAFFRDAYRRPPEQWWEGHPGSGETFRQFHDRVAAAIVDLLAQRGITPHRDRLADHLWSMETGPRRILVVGHAGTNAVALGFLLGLEPTPWEWERFVLGHASLAALGTFPLGGAHIFTLRWFNDREHLPAELRSR
jgi:probable phosphoglycerate mutase